MQLSKALFYVIPVLFYHIILTTWNATWQGFELRKANVTNVTNSNPVFVPNETGRTTTIKISISDSTGKNEKPIRVANESGSIIIELKDNISIHIVKGNAVAPPTLGFVHDSQSSHNIDKSSTDMKNFRKFKSVDLFENRPEEGRIDEEQLPNKISVEEERVEVSRVDFNQSCEIPPSGKMLWDNDKYSLGFNATYLPLLEFADTTYRGNFTGEEHGRATGTKQWRANEFALSRLRQTCEGELGVTSALLDRKNVCTSDAPTCIPPLADKTTILDGGFTFFRTKSPLASSHLSCFERHRAVAPFAEHICDGKNLMIDFGRLVDGMMLHCAEGGCIVGNCRHSGFALRMWGQVGTVRQMMDLFNKTQRPREDHCDAWVNHTIVFASRYDVHNMYHSHQQLVTFLQNFGITGVPVSDVQLVVMDSFHDSDSFVSFDAMFQSMFSHKGPIIHWTGLRAALEPFCARRICFKRTIWMSHAGISPLSSYRSHPTPCLKAPLLKASTLGAFNTMNITSEEKMCSDVVNGSIPVRLTILNRKKTRSISNVEYLASEMPRRNPKVKAEVVYFESLTMNEQLNKIRHTDLLISPHGAGLIWTAYLLPYAGMLEIMHPSRHRNFQFQNLATHYGLIHDYREVWSDPASLNEMHINWILKKIPEIQTRKGEFCTSGRYYTEDALKKLIPTFPGTDKNGNHRTHVKSTSTHPRHTQGHEKLRVTYPSCPNAYNQVGPTLVRSN